MKLIIFCLLLHAIQFAHCRSLNELISELLRLKFPSKLEPSMFENELVNEDGVDARRIQKTYELTPWSQVSNCSKVCGGGSKRSTRTCVDVDTGKQVLLEYCGVKRTSLSTNMDIFRRFVGGSDHIQQSRDVRCNTSPCETTNWSKWSSCSRICGGGKMTSSRDCLNSANQDNCEFEKTREQYCNLEPCFKMSEWSEYSNCSADCGGGIQIRRRSCELAVQSKTSNFAQFESLKQTADYLGKMASLSGNFLKEFVENMRVFHMTEKPTVFNLQYMGKKLDYFDVVEYMKRCQAPKEDKRVCSLRNCPKCPGNQVYHKCKPCTQTCNTDKSTINFFRQYLQNSQLVASRLVEQIYGCNDVCEAGCSCPVRLPYLSENGNCYKLPAFCPKDGDLIKVARTDMSGKEFQMTAVPPKFRPTEQSTNELMTDATPKIQESQAVNNNNGGIETKEDKTEKDVELMESTIIDIEEDLLEDCLYNIMIATTPGFIPCNCQGTIEVTKCYLTKGTSCPVICRDTSKSSLRCPQASIDVVLKSNRVCGECNENTDCSSSGEICCKTSCGMQCVIGEY